MFSVLDMFSIGVGPSSSHTVGPMRAAHDFAQSLDRRGLLDRVARVRVTLYGSLSLTGLGHGTDRAAVAGLEGAQPDTVDTDRLLAMRKECERTGTLRLAGKRAIAFDYDRDVTFDQWRRFAAHPNGMRFEAFDAAGASVDEQVWYSIGGGFIRQGDIDDRLIGIHERPQSETTTQAGSDTTMVGDGVHASDTDARAADTNVGTDGHDTVIDTDSDTGADTIADTDEHDTYANEHAAGTDTDSGIGTDAAVTDARSDASAGSDEHVARADTNSDASRKAATYTSTSADTDTHADNAAAIDTADATATPTASIPYEYATCDELIAICKRERKSIADVVWANETAMCPAERVRERVLAIWGVMRESVELGCTSTETVLPGGLDVQRRAPKMYARLAANGNVLRRDTGRIDAVLESSDAAWVDLFALAVSEQNAGGRRIVTAPTNGSAGIIPAVLMYYWHFVDVADEEGVIRFLLTAGAIGYLFKRNASISGAEVGCQGEVGVACSMAAAGLAAVLGGTPEQVENAAEIGIEHFLGLTCDPVGGLVQIPCIERNAMGANAAINAVRMAMLGDGSHVVSLDQAIRTMKQTGEDMMSKYKETSRGGLAVNVVEC